MGKILPETGRGTMRSMVEGARRLAHFPADGPLHHAACGVAVPLSVPGRI